MSINPLNRLDLLITPPPPELSILFQQEEDHLTKRQRVFSIICMCFLILGISFISIGLYFLAIATTSGALVIGLGLGSVLLGLVLLGIGIVVFRYQEEKIFENLDLSQERIVLDSRERETIESDQEQQSYAQQLLNHILEMKKQITNCIQDLQSVISNRGLGIEEVSQKFIFVEKLSELVRVKELNISSKDVDHRSEAKELLAKLTIDSSEPLKILSKQQEMLLEVEFQEMQLYQATSCKKDLWMYMECVLLKKEIECIQKKQLLTTMNQTESCRRERLLALESKYKIAHRRYDRFQEMMLLMESEITELRSSIDNLSFEDVKQGIKEVLNDFKDNQQNIDQVLGDVGTNEDILLVETSQKRESAILHQCRVNCLRESKLRALLAIYKYALLRKISDNHQQIVKAKTAADKVFYDFQEKQACLEKILEIEVDIASISLQAVSDEET
ncbi:hypothetical protein C10C_0187 [Chlamydia serpentis]|uniref:IncA family protein n=1 Tax=Chlamydia serpentis TaxID=1967782 RepID=A0A2R8FAT7_9CHLA|nr:hypothetical protein [Chlamydia serpentis]SPN73367.1 hypothetical protein C10C_0187 [Chlamydia serpentis]